MTTGPIVAATGHRPDKLGFGARGYTEPVRLKLVAFARQQLEGLAPQKVISGMALGWDQAVAEAALDLGVPLLAAVPCDDQDITWPFMSRKRYRDVLSRTGVETHVVCPGPYKPWKMQARNEWMVDRASLLLALWDGSPGGTANAVGYFHVKLARCHDGTVSRFRNVWAEWENWAR